MHLQSRHPFFTIMQNWGVACQVGVHWSARNDAVCCFAVQVQTYSYNDMVDMKLPGMGVSTTLKHLRPKPPKKDRKCKVPPTFFAPVVEEEPSCEEEEEEKEEGARSEGGVDDQDKGAQTGDHPVGS